jgi:hypothetical protein
VFRVVLSGQIRERIRDLHRRARQHGQGALFLSAFREVMDRLRNMPFQFGEPRFTLAQLDLEVRVGTIHGLAVTYGVHRHRSLVFVSTFNVLPGSGF